MKTKTKTILKFIFFIIIFVGITILFWKPLSQLFSTPEDIQEFIHGFGILAPIIFIIAAILQVLLAPIPGQAIGLAGGYLFGTILGTIYSMIGLMIGSFIVFYLAKRLGRKFVEKVVKKKTLNKFDKLIRKKGVPVLFLIYLLPVLPDDLVCYVAGLTKIKIKTLMIISALGRLPGIFILNLVGSGLASESSLFSLSLLVAMVIISIVIYLNRNELERIMVKLIKK